jgi:hypothetical protein
LLILSRGAEPRIEAEATTNGDTVIVRLMNSPWPRGAARVDRPVCHTHAGQRAARRCRGPNAFAADASSRAARSIHPLRAVVNQAKLTGVLYLETP